MKCIKLGAILLILIAIPVGIRAQLIDTKSQIRLAYEAKSAFVGEVVYVVEPPEGVYTTPSFAQTMVLRINRNIKGHAKSFNSYVGLSIAVTKDIRLQISRGESLIVLLNDQSISVADNCEFGTLPEQIVSARDAGKIPCYWIENSRSILPASKEELNAIRALLR